MEEIATPCNLNFVLMDFGGVIAEEGFANGLRAIGRLNGKDPERIFQLGRELVHETGYVTGKADEKFYWRAFRERTGFTQDDESLRREILGRFIIRPWMLDIADLMRNSGMEVSILSDQTNWLDELNAEHGLFRHFDHVFNSYHLGRSKRDPLIFDRVLAFLDARPERTLFIDDEPSHCDRARGRGIRAIRFKAEAEFRRDLNEVCPFLPFTSTA